MCVVSMVMDHYREKWEPLVPMIPYPAPTVPMPTDAEIQEFRQLLERAREYDRRNNEPNCELDEKRQTLKRIADALGFDISFVDKTNG